MKKIEIFGRTHTYDFEFEIKYDIKVISELMQKIREPQILLYSGMETVNIYIPEDENFICHDCIEWIYMENKDRLHEEYIRDCLLKCSSEDKEWTEQRNKDLTGIFYRKITFLPEIQDAVCKALSGYLQNLNEIRAEMIEEKQKQKEEIDRLKSEWSVTKVLKKVYPTGGECGKDGYIDAEYTSQDGEIVRMVSRDVFDVGCYDYPKRLEGKDDIFDRELWTDTEKRAAIWINKFGEFHGIRM